MLNRSEARSRKKKLILKQKIVAPNTPSTNDRALSLSPSTLRQMQSRTCSTDYVDDISERLASGLNTDPSCSIAMNKVESLLATPRGDLLVCRDRTSASAFEESDSLERNKRDDSPERWCNNDMFQETTFCNPCADNSVSNSNATVFFRRDGGGLKGGSEDSYSITNRQHDGLLGGALPLKQAKAMRSDTESTDNDDDTIYGEIRTKSKVKGSRSVDLSMVPSFDYSQYDESDVKILTRTSLDTLSIKDEGTSLTRGPAIMEKTALRKAKGAPPVIDLPATKKEATRTRPVKVPFVLHGVPNFLPALSQIQIKQVSANPLGSHVLMISSEALLFSYGLNVHGQLGLGFKSLLNDNSGFVTTPIIVTPLLENGGKAVACAAGVNHSLVVVKTEGRRVGRLRSHNRVSRSQPKQSSHDPIQVIRVISSPSRLVSDRIQTEEDLDHIERTVHVHQLYGFGKNDCMKLGLLNPPQSTEEEDVLLPKRVALQCQIWPEAGGGGMFSIAAGEYHSAALVHRPTGAVELYTWGDATRGALGFTTMESGFNKSVLAPRVAPIPTLVESLSYQPMFYRGDKSQSSETRLQTIAAISATGNSILSITGRRPEIPVQVALGRNSTFIVTSNGRCFSFGNCLFGLLGHGNRSTTLDDPTAIAFPQVAKNLPHINFISIGAKHALATDIDGHIYQWGTDAVTGHADWYPRTINCSHVVKACAGYDSSIVVKKDGKTLSFGKESGRLGLGESCCDQQQPTPLFGGLHLWR
jgi:alpha-tubulin suppressor-like RCC1 family protein